MDEASVKEVAGLVRQFGDLDAPFEARANAARSLAAKLPDVGILQDTVVLFKEAEDAQGSDAYRGYLSALSLKSKSGQRILMDVKKGVKKAMGETETPAEAAEPKAPKERKPRKKAEPSVRCACGCGKLVHNFFAPGHDAKVHGLLLKVSRGEAQLSEIHPDTLPHLKDFCIRWKVPTDADGNIVVTPVPKKEKKAKAEKAAA